MGAFNYEWSDFRAGLCVFSTDVNQPKNSWKGENVTLADDDSTLVPTYEPTTMTLSSAISNGSTATTWSEATYFNGVICLVGRTSTTATVYFIATATGTVTSASLPSAGTSCGGAPVLVPIGTDIAAYVAVGGTSIYKVLKSTLGITTINVGSSTYTLTNLTLWNSRMIAWSSASDVFVFSEALDFDTSWPTLNYVGVGYSNDGISYCVPRNLDLVVVKPSGWYSITGVLGANAAVRQMNDTLGILPTDPVAQHNNVVYFSTNTGYNDYSINLLAITGANVEVAAYQRFGYSNTNMSVTSTNIGYLAVSTVTTDGTTNYATIFLRNFQNRWQVIKTPSFITSGTNTKFSVARGQVSRYNSAQDKYLYLVEYSTGTNNKVAIKKILPNTVEPGKIAGSNDPSSATVKLSNITLTSPVIIKRVYVEAEMLQPPNSYYGGSASLQVRINNRAVRDIAFSQTIGDDNSALSTAYTYPFSTFSSSSTAGYSQIRVMRFDTNDAAYGYTVELEMQFAGMRVRRVWVEGDTA